jgi:hypothetical protein
LVASAHLRVIAGLVGHSGTAQKPMERLDFLLAFRETGWLSSVVTQLNGNGCVNYLALLQWDIPVLVPTSWPWSIFKHAHEKY